MPFDHAPGIQAAVRRAPRERLIRFLRLADPGRPPWHGDPEGWPDMALRSAAFVAADRFWAVRRANRLARAAPRLPARIPPGHTAFPCRSGAELDAWLRGLDAAAFAIGERHHAA